MTQVKQKLGWVCLALFSGWVILFFVALVHKITPPMPAKLNPEQVALAEELKILYYPIVRTVTADDGSVVYCPEYRECSNKLPSWIDPQGGDVLMDQTDQWKVAQLSNTETFWGATMKVREYNRLRKVLIAGMIFSGIFFTAYLLPPGDLGKPRKYGVIRWFILVPFACLVFYLLSGGMFAFVIYLASIVTGPLLLFLSLWSFNTSLSDLKSSDAVNA